MKTGSFGRLAKAIVSAALLAVLQIACTHSPTTASAEQPGQVLSPDVAARILALPKGSRPDPATYLSPQAIEAHLAHFYPGASFLIPKAMLDKYGRDPLGYPDNSQFVMTAAQMDALLARARGDVSIIERELGLPAGAWAGQAIVRITIPNPKSVNVRLPSGNEMGANALWLPGGKLPNGMFEAVVNQLRPADYQEKPL